ncbi:hypothetical protein GLOIN_2v1761388 [Rhizophagus clarus]|uniref:Uncharacterized protein n=1 Tax=Rhizophagus clarus TaxID=94130 RepID=A0A8H3MFS4_9GLOM|nr:hypothetical protein GLOIN_2v1761388 [Rhizophagus clarus]
MRLPIIHVRILIFAFTLVCLTLDSLYVNISGVNTNIASDNTSTIGINIGYQGPAAYFLINDLISFLLCGYYIIRMEYKWNNAPNLSDYIGCGLEIVLWIIYVSLKFKSEPDTITIVYGFLTIISYIVICALYYNLILRIRKFGEDKLTPLSQPKNNSNVATDNAINNTSIEIQEHN